MRQNREHRLVLRRGQIPDGDDIAFTHLFFSYIGN